MVIDVLDAVVALHAWYHKQAGTSGAGQGIGNVTFVYIPICHIYDGHRDGSGIN